MAIENLDDILLKAVKDRIQAFNKARGRRKELAPDFVETISRPCKKYGLRIDYHGMDNEIPDIISRMARAVVWTLLRRKPRPLKIAVNMYRTAFIGDDCEYTVRLLIPRKKEEYRLLVH